MENRMMITAEQKKTLELSVFVFEIALLANIILPLFRGKIEKYLFSAPSTKIPSFIFLIAGIVIIISTLVLLYQSAKILKEYGKTKLRPIFWLILSIVPVPICSIVTFIIILNKINRLLREPVK